MQTRTTVMIAAHGVLSAKTKFIENLPCYSMRIAGAKLVPGSK